MSTPHETNRPAIGDTKENGRSFLDFLFSGDANNKSFREKATLEDVEELYNETK